MLHALGVQWNDRKYWWRAGGCCGAWDSIFASAQTGVGSGRNAQKKQKMAVLFLNEQDYGSSISSLAVVELLGVGVLGLVDLLLRDSGAFGEEAGQAVQHAQVALDVVSSLLSNSSIAARMKSCGWAVSTGLVGMES